MPATSEKEKIADAALPAPSDLNNGLTFPAFWDLPSEYEISESYLSSTTPRKHWCFLGKIISSNVLVRLTLEVEDKAGHRLLVAFHTDDRGAAFQDLCLQDHTIAVIKVFPYSLDHMLEASGELFDKGRGKRCEVCRMVDAPLKKCAGCKGAWYCSKASKSSFSGVGRG